MQLSMHRRSTLQLERISIGCIRNVRSSRLSSWNPCCSDILGAVASTESQYRMLQIRAKIVEGRLSKMKTEQALLSQAYIRSESNEPLEDVLKARIAEIGEKISIRRFVRYNLGEGLEKKSDDFAAEVAAQTEAKDAAPEPPKV